MIFLTLAIASTSYGFGYYNSNSQTYGNTTYTNTYGPNGYNVNTNTQQFGNSIYSNAYDNRGHSAHCTTQVIGGSTYTNCY
jgi:hypothetical protein